MSERTVLAIGALCTVGFIAYIAWLTHFYFSCDGVVVEAIRFPPYACVQVQP